MPAPGPHPIQTDTASRSVAFVSLGCPKNLVDSEKMLGVLTGSGLRLVTEAEGGMGAGADAVVINTCGFLEASKQESLDVIGEALEHKKAGRIGRVVVAGCLVQRHRAKLLEWAPGIDAMIGVFDRDHILDAVGGPHGSESRATRGALPGEGERPKYWIAGNALQAAKERGRDVVGLTVQGKDGKGVGYFEDDSHRVRLTPRHYAYLRISEGCNQRCAFCTIPSIRGKMRSKPLDAIVREAGELIDDGAFELNLIGQDTTSYGDDVGFGLNFDGAGGGGLPAMLRALNDVVADRAGASGGGWVRLMYAYPSNFSDEMIEAIAELPHVMKYIDMPLQHASDRMLTAMRRNVTSAHQRGLIERLRERIPGMALRTTFITGFPGETEEDHEQLLEFIDEVGFEMMGVFEYSREEGTPAGTMDQDPALHVPAEVKARRRDELMRLQQSVAFEQAAYLASQFDEKDPENTGLRFDVLIDEALPRWHGSPSREANRSEANGSEENRLGEPIHHESPEENRLGEPIHHRLHKGRAYFQAPQIDSVIYVQSRERLSPGELVRCTVVGSDGYDLVAKPSEELARRRSLPVIR